MERGSKWKKQKGINDFPTKFEFSVELTEEKQEEEFREIIAGKLQNIMPSGVNSQTSGYVGFTPGMGLGIQMEAPFKVYEDLKKKVCMPYPIVFGPESIFSDIKRIPETEYRNVDTESGDKYIIALFNGDLRRMYNNYKYLFIDFYGKKYRDEDAEGDIKINGRIVARTKKGLKSL